jgi:hypothetical protein
MPNSPAQQSPLSALAFSLAAAAIAREEGLRERTVVAEYASLEKAIAPMTVPHMEKP